MYHCEKPMGVCNYYFKHKNTISEKEVITLKQKGQQPSLPRAVEEDDNPGLIAIQGISCFVSLLQQRFLCCEQAPKSCTGMLCRICNFRPRNRDRDKNQIQLLLGVGLGKCFASIRVKSPSTVNINRAYHPAIFLASVSSSVNPCSIEK